MAISATEKSQEAADNEEARLRAEIAKLQQESLELEAEIAELLESAVMAEAA